jgi:hypothetical protein
MKISICTFFTVITLMSVKAQDFVGKDVKLYLNSTIKPKEISEKSQKYAYKNFYLQFDTISKVLTKDAIGKKKKDFKPFQTGEYASTSVSEYSKLVGIEFKVTGVYEETPQFDFDKGKFYVLALFNQELGTIYYKYDTRYKHNIEFEVVGQLEFPEGYWCGKFIVKNDLFEDKTSFYSPKESGFTLIKIVKNGTINYYLSVDEKGSTANVDGKGLFLLFNDGTKITKSDAKIDVSISDRGGFIYTAFVELTLEELETLKTKTITANRLYIYDGTVGPESAKLLQEYAKCLEVK